ncbi:MAG: cell division protein FtsL [Elusimicrobiota bacterium]
MIEKIKVLSIYLGAALVILVSMMFFIWQRIDLVHTGYELQDLNKKQDALFAEVSELEVEILRLKALSRIEDIAKNKLGLREAKNDEIIIFNVGK